jgi:c-di-GMP-related signal transduction protein
MMRTESMIPDRLFFSEPQFIDSKFMAKKEALEKIIELIKREFEILKISQILPNDRDMGFHVFILFKEKEGS